MNIEHIKKKLEALGFEFSGYHWKKKVAQCTLFADILRTGDVMLFAEPFDDSKDCVIISVQKSKKTAQIVKLLS